MYDTVRRYVNGTYIQYTVAQLYLYVFVILTQLYLYVFVILYTNDTCDNYLRHLYRGSFYLIIRVCFLECYTVKWLKQQGVMFEAMTMAC